MGTGVLPGQADLRQVGDRSAGDRDRRPRGSRPSRWYVRAARRPWGGRRRTRPRGSSGPVRPGAGDHYADQHRHRGNCGDRPHPPRGPGPATELDHIV